MLNLFKAFRKTNKKHPPSNVDVNDNVDSSPRGVAVLRSYSADHLPPTQPKESKSFFGRLRRSFRISSSKRKAFVRQEHVAELKEESDASYVSDVTQGSLSDAPTVTLELSTDPEAKQPPSELVENGASTGATSYIFVEYLEELAPKLHFTATQLAKLHRELSLALSGVTGFSSLSYFRDMKQICAGSYAKVYYAKDRRVGDKDIALKRISAAYQAKESIIAEIQFSLKGDFKHANLMAAEECFFANLDGERYLWLSMKYMEGGDLRYYLHLGFSEPQMATIMSQVLCGVAFMHSQGYIHRDVQSSNILLALDGSVRLADFGFVSRTCEKFDVHFGNPRCVPPEVARFLVKSMSNETVIRDGALEDELLLVCYSSKVDIWALGLVLAEMVDGKSIFLAQYAENRRNLAAFYSFIASCKHAEPRKMEDCSKPLQSFIRLCLNPKPMHRSSAISLREHAFVASAAAKESLVELITKARANHHLP